MTFPVLAVHFQPMGGSGGGECDPYTRHVYNAMNIDLTQTLSRVAENAVDVNLCEEMT